MLYPIELRALDAACQLLAFSLSEPSQLLDNLNADKLFQMGGTRLELVTSTMSTWRSNQLS